LSCIGVKIPLRGWQGFDGGLNVDKDFDGTHSFYAKYKHHEIMFHVSTYLSHNETDSQHLSKKKHIGNNIVNIVFMEPGAPPLDPTFMRTQFTHVYILVQPFYPDAASVAPYFRISVVAKDGVRPFGPSIPQNVDFELDYMLKSFLLLKLINAERAALASPTFQEKLVKAREMFLSSLLNTYK
jgi:hypothetical protein